MPQYVYETVLADGQGGDRFEIRQPIADPALTHHPLTGEPVRRVLFAPQLTTRYSDRHTKQLLDNKRVEKAGFTKYQRDPSTNTYHRVAGKEGPATFKKPGDV
jgi:hypothetical protein